MVTPQPYTPDSTNSPTTQTFPRPHSSSHNQFYSRETSETCSNMIVSSLIIAVAFLLLLVVLVVLF